MTFASKRAVAAILPYAVWMAMMMLLPQTGECYAARTLVCALLLAPCLVYLDGHQPVIHRNRRMRAELGWGVLAGLAVFAVWIWPEQFAWYRRWLVAGEGGTRAIEEGAMWVKIVRLLGSAFVVSVAEELFFRKWLMRFAGFWWTLLLFAVEHDRWLVGAFAGLVYGWLALRKGFGAAVVAHVATNLALGLYVLETGSWQLW